MGCCCGKKPVQRPKPEQAPMEKYQEPPQKREEIVQEEEQVVVVVEQPRKAVELKSAPPPVSDKFSLSDLDRIPGAHKLNEKEKQNLFRALIILDSKGYKVTQVITVVNFGMLLNVQSNDGRTVCMKVLFHDESLLPTQGNEEEGKRILTKELEVIKRVNDPRVLKYKSHFIDNGKSLDSPALKKMSSEQILFVEQEDSVNSTFQEFINQNRGKLNDRQFLIRAQDLIRGMDHLFQQGCVNRALNPEKIVVSTDGKKLKYCDFRDMNLADKNQQIKNLTKEKLQQTTNIQSPQIQYYLKNKPDSIYQNDKTDIWNMGAILAQLSDIDDKRFNAFSSPDNNQGYVGDDDRAKATHQKNALLKAMASLSPNTNQSKSAAPESQVKNEFPGSSKLNDDCNELLVQILEIDEPERQMHKITGRMDFLAIKYHLNEVQPRHMPDYMKGKQIKSAPQKSEMSKLESTVASDPSNSQARAQLAACIFQNDKTNNKKGIELINRAIELEPNNAEYYNIQGALYERELMIEEAEKSFKIAAEKDPQSSLPLHNLGYLNQKILQNPNEAIKYYQKAIEKNNKSESSIFNIALALKDQNKPQEAKQHYENLMKINSKDSQLYNNLGVLYMQTPELRDQNSNQNDDPEALFQKAIQLNPNDTCALVNLSQVQINKDAGYEMHEEEINKNLAHAQKISPKHAYTYYVKGLVEMVKPIPNWEYAIENFNLALKHYPSFSLAAYQIGLIYYEVDTIKKSPEQSIELYEKAVIYDKNNFLAYYSLAIALEEVLKFTNDQTATSRLRAKCMFNYRKAIQIKPDYTEALNNLGVFLKTVALQEGKLKKNSKEFEVIESYLKHAESLAPHHRIIIDNLEKLYIEVQQEDLAQQSNIKATLVGEE